MKRCCLALLIACGPSRPGPEPGAVAPPARPRAMLPAACEDVRAKVESMYRAEATAREPRRVAEAVADNTAMVLAECAGSPAKVSACVAAAASVQAIEAQCLAPLDDEGSEGDRLARS